MRIGVDARVLLRKGNGIRNYSESILEYLLRQDSRNEYIFYLDGKGDLGDLQSPTCHVITSRVPWPISLPRFLRKDRVDLLFAPSSTLPLVKACKSVITIHDLSFEVCPSWYTLKDYICLHLSFKMAVKRADRIMADSIATKRDLMAYYGVAEEKIRTVYLGVNTELFKPEMSRGVLEEFVKKYCVPERFILYIGAVNVRKNIQGMLTAFSRAKKMGVEQKLVINGPKSGPDIDFHLLLKRLDLEREVIWVVSGHKELPVFYDMADFLVYPSFYEGFGLPILEAMACGTPVITSNTSSMPEIVGNDALLVNPHNVDSLAKAIYALSTDRNLRLRLREKGLERIQEFSWEKTAKETIGVFEETSK